MLKNKVAKQPARSIPPSLALLWRCLLAQIHSFPLFSQVQLYQQLFLLLARGSNSAAGHLCQTAPFLCRLCIPASSRKSAGNVIFSPRPPATQGLFLPQGFLSTYSEPLWACFREVAAHLPGSSAESGGVAGCIWASWVTDGGREVRRLKAIG